jgi:hypothetical protein
VDGEKAYKKGQRGEQSERSGFGCRDGCQNYGVRDAEVWIVVLLAGKKLKQDVGQDPIPRWATEQTRVRSRNPSNDTQCIQWEAS